MLIISGRYSRSMPKPTPTAIMSAPTNPPDLGTAVSSVHSLVSRRLPTSWPALHDATLSRTRSADNPPELARTLQWPPSLRGCLRRVHGEFVIEVRRGGDPAPLLLSPMLGKLLVHEKCDFSDGASAGQTGRSPGNWRDPSHSRREYPLEAAAPRPAALSPPSAQSSHRRPLAHRVLCPVREPSSANPHGHHPQARHLVALSSCVQGFQISIPSLLESKEKARSKRARSGTDPSHL